MTCSSLRAVIAAAACVSALALYAYGFHGEPGLRDIDSRQRVYAAHVLQGAALELPKELALAEAYWRRYSDVATDPVFGRTGQLGVHGAREHYNRHGRREKRIWGKN